MLIGLPSAGGKNPEPKLSSYQIATPMKIWKNLFGRGDKIHADEIAVAPGLLLGGAVIVESGSNENGEYVRFGDGTQVCWHRVPVTELCEVSAGALYRTNSMTWTFPKPFVNNTARAFFEANSLNRWAHGATTATNESVKFRVMRPDVSTYLGSVEAFAIGRWK